MADSPRVRVSVSGYGVVGTRVAGNATAHPEIEAARVRLGPTRG